MMPELPFDPDARCDLCGRAPAGYDLATYDGPNWKVFCAESYRVDICADCQGRPISDLVSALEDAALRGLAAGES